MQPVAIAAVSWGPNRIDVFGMGTNNELFHKTWDGSAWLPSQTDWEALGGVFNSIPVAVSWGSDRIDLFGLGTDNQMYHKAWDGSAWSPSQTDWEPLGGVFTSPPAAVCWSPNRIDIFGLGTNFEMYHKAWDGNAWLPSQTDWESLGGVFVTPPAVVSWGENRIDIFGVGTNEQLFHKVWDGSAWLPSQTDWESLGGQIVSPPAAVCRGANQIDLFVLGTSFNMYHKAWNGTAWLPSQTDWQSLSGVFNSQAAAVSWGPNRFDIFGLGTNDEMFHKSWDGSAWGPSLTDWEALGGNFLSAPVAVCWGSDRIDIFGLGTDDQMYHKAWNVSAWLPSLTDWEPLGGVFTRFPPPTKPPVVPSEKANLYVDGRFLYDRHGNQVVLRGVNYPLLDDWQFPPNSFLSEIAQSGANAIRIQWYVNYDVADGVTRDPSYSTSDLGTFLDACIAANIVPIVMLADKTCNSDATLINSYYVPWWTDPANADVLKARQQCLILNLANELGYWEWADDPAGALASYTSSYKTAIASMRAAGYTCPLMIDAPDCGSKLSAFTTTGDGRLSVGAELVAADPLGNILLSAHAYWAGYDGRPFIPTAIAANLPIVFGEIANKQDEVVNGDTVYCYYDLDGTHVAHPTNNGFTYQSFLTSLVADQIGWLAWCWTNDKCSPRQMTPNGYFAKLGTFGSDIVNNATYGLKATAVKVTL